MPQKNTALSGVKVRIEYARRTAAVAIMLRNRILVWSCVNGAISSMPRPLVRPVTPEDRRALQRVRTVSVRDRQHKVHVADFVDPRAWPANGNLRALFPRLLKGLDLADIVGGFVAAHQRRRAIILAMGEIGRASWRESV